MSWVELHLEPDADLIDVYTAVRDGAPDGGVINSHHFWDEPWNPGAFVIRLETEPGGLADALLEAVSERVDVREVVPWDSAPDAEMYGGYWPHVRDWFHLSSVINSSLLRDAPPAARASWSAKLIHCFLNQQQLSPWGEAKFLARFAVERVRTGLGTWLLNRGAST